MQRRDLRFDTIDELVADVRRLREGGYERCGTWSLEQACWHLDKIMRYMMDSGVRTPNTPEQDAARPMMEMAIATGRIPSGIQAPEPVRPPADAAAEAVDRFIETNGRIKTFNGPYATHRLFGNLPDEVVLTLHLLHSAHHLSHFVPKG